MSDYGKVQSVGLTIFVIVAVIMIGAALAGGAWLIWRLLT
jgi:hypothetical protein